MKIELKNTEFKALYEWLKDEISPNDKDIGPIVHKKLKPQYEKAFLKYQDEKQQFRKHDKIEFKFVGRGQGWWEGRIHTVSRLANGQYRYIIQYDDVDEYSEETYRFTNPLTKKNIRRA